MRIEDGGWRGGKMKMGRKFGRKVHRGKEVWIGLEYLNSLYSVNRLYVLGGIGTEYKICIQQSYW